MSSTHRLLLLTSALAFATPAAAAPANLCQELLAFVNGVATGSPQQASTAPSGEKPGGATAVEQGGGKPGGQDDAQRTSGMSGPVTNHGPGADGPQGDAQRSAPSTNQTQTQGQRKMTAAESLADARKQAKGASAAPPAPKAPPPSQDMIEKARAAASSSDFANCRKTAQEIRRAGVAMPAPLLALAALDPAKAPAPAPTPVAPAPGGAPAAVSPQAPAVPDAPAPPVNRR